LPPITHAIGSPFIELQQVESTNNYATGLVHAGMAHHGISVFAHHQTKGKGQRNKSWNSAAGENITTSIVIEPLTLTITKAFLLSKAIAVACFEFYKTYAGDETKIKWPNDVYWRDRKAGGILIENILSGTLWKYAIVGIGINVNQTIFPEITNAVSLKQITGRSFDTIDLVKVLYKNVESNIELLKQDSAAIEETYHKHLYKINETVKLKKDNRVFDTTIKGVSERGQLLTKHSVDEAFDVGEVEWII
jgi:BirA family transcriptional regulator, biotin operon repressor / biotin---[acetyl-CoA-carboxylase] ligase